MMSDTKRRAEPRTDTQKAVYDHEASVTLADLEQAIRWLTRARDTYRAEVELSWGKEKFTRLHDRIQRLALARGYALLALSQLEGAADAIESEAQAAEAAELRVSHERTPHTDLEEDR